MKTIKVGIVGLGRAGWGTIPGEILNEKIKGMYEIVAACDMIPERVADAVEKYNCKGYASIDELILDENVEMVIIATRSIDHYEHAMKALKAGKNVVVEKPVSVNYDLATKLFEYGMREDTPKLYPRQNRRFERVFNDVLNKVKSGLLGTVTEINIEQRGYERRDDWQTLNEFGGGLILNWGPHIVDHALRLMGAEVKEQYGLMQRSTAGGDREDNFSMHLVGENGRKVNIWISGASALNQGRIFEVYGNRGAMVCHNGNVKLKYINPEQVLPEVVSDRGTPANSWGKSGTFETVITPEWIEEEYEIDETDFHLGMWSEIHDDFCGIGKYSVKPEEILAMMKTISNLRDGQEILDMTAHRDSLK